MIIKHINFDELVYLENQFPGFLEYEGIKYVNYKYNTSILGVDKYRPILLDYLSKHVNLKEAFEKIDNIQNLSNFKHWVLSKSQKMELRKFRRKNKIRIIKHL